MSDDWAVRLARGDVIDEPVAIVVAHPDDETLFAGPLLRRLRIATLIVVTDGAPEDPAYARAHGFATPADYGAARAGELERALAALGADARLIRYDVSDQAAVLHLPALIDRLARDLAGTAVVATHPYEGGHPDHDAVALAVQAACARLGATAPARVEFACYARFDGTRHFWRFVDDAACPERRRLLDPDDRVRLEAALAAHGTQADVFGTLRPDAERWRAAPCYDFRLPPPGEACLYDGFGWPLRSADWRRHARAVAQG